MLESLPTDILIYIFLYLGLQEVIVIERINKAFNCFINERFWTFFGIKTFGKVFQELLVCQKDRPKNVFILAFELTKLKPLIKNVSIIDMVKLDKFDHTNKLLTKIPNEFGKLQALRVLYLNNNKLHLLPESFGNLQALQELYLTNNKLSLLPKSFGNLKALQRLYLTKNQLSLLPKSFGNLQALRVLYLDKNKLTKRQKKPIKIILSLNVNVKVTF
jgi:hypothetical protein